MPASPEETGGGKLRCATPLMGSSDEALQIEFYFTSVVSTQDINSKEGHQLWLSYFQKNNKKQADKKKCQGKKKKKGKGRKEKKTELILIDLRWRGSLRRSSSGLWPQEVAHRIASCFSFSVNGVQMECHLLSITHASPWGWSQRNSHSSYGSSSSAWRDMCAEKSEHPEIRDFRQRISRLSDCFFFLSLYCLNGNYSFTPTGWNAGRYTSPSKV